MNRQRAGLWGVIVMIGAAAGCAGPPSTVLEQLVESRRLSAELIVQFTKATDAANRAVMADTDEASVAFAGEAGQATAMVQKDSDALTPLLRDLGYSAESRLLDEFGTRFAAYLALDRSILELAVENTNLKAQRLSFGPAEESAGQFRMALEAVAPASAGDAWQVKALVAMAVGSVREIQALQAPHIAESDDAAMTRLEQRMAASEAAARSALKTLESVCGVASRPKLAAATAALDKFRALNAQIIELSRRNSNVRSLALSLGQKRTLTAACEDSLVALQDALLKRGFAGTR